MTRLNNISQIIARMVFTLALLLSVSLNTAAQTDYSQTSVWDGSDSPTPSGETTLRSKSLVDPSIDTTDSDNAPGSATNPYLIESAADLKYLQTKTNLWGKCFEQMVDIDLNNVEWTPIGSSNGNTAFSGKYNGCGHVIKNIYIPWGSGEDNNLARGLFGYVTGEIRNLVVDHALLTRKSTYSTSAIAKDYKIGILVGSLAPKSSSSPAVLENISIINSKISDGKIDTKMGATFAGGLVGDVASSYGGYALLDGNIKINNIYSDVEVDFAQSTPNAGMAYQLNVGGIIGRLRRVKAADMPTNTVFTGKIITPNGMIGPIFGAARADATKDAKSMRFHYAGQLQTDDAVDINKDTKNELYNSTTFNATNHFYDYWIWNSDDNAEKLVTDSWPTIETSLTSGNTVTIRTIVQPSATSTATSVPAIDMRGYQGVNQGHLVADASGANTILSSFSSDYDWKLDVSTKDATFSEKTTATHSLAAEHTAWNKFTATLTGTDAGFHYRWFAVNAKGERTEIGLSESTVLEGSYPVPTGTTELIVFLCNADDTYYLDNGHYVYAFCLPKYMFEALELTATPAADKVRNVLTPKLKVRNLQTDEIIETTSFDGWEFEVKVYNGNTLKYTFPDKFAGADAPFTIPPTVSFQAKIEIIGSFGQVSFTSAKVSFPHYLLGTTSSGWSREKAEDGQRYTLTFSNVTSGGKDKNGNNIDEYGDKVYFDSDKGLTADWDITYSWDIGYYVASSDPFNGIKNKTLTLSEEWEEDGTLKAWVKDLASCTRYYKLSYTDKYGITNSSLFQYGNAWIDIAHTNLRYVLKRDGFQNYHFKLQFANDSYVGSDGKNHDYPHITINPEMYDHFKWTYSVLDGENEVADEQNLPLTVFLGDFSIQNVYLKPRTYVFTYTDRYEQAKEYKEKLTLNAPEAKLVIVNGKVHAELTFDESTYFIKEEDGRGLTYSWEVTFLDDNDAPIGTTQSYTGNELPAQAATAATKKIKVHLTITDCKGDTEIVDKTFSVDNLYVDVAQTGTASNGTFTASLNTSSGFPLDGATWQWYGLKGDSFEYYDPSGTSYELLDGETARSIALNNYADYSTFYVTCTLDGQTYTAYCSRQDVIYVYDKTATTTFSNSNSKRYESLLAKGYPDGDDANLGRTPDTAVKTMARAYQLLTADRSMEDNKIIVMGYLNDTKFVTADGDILRNHSADYNKNAFITGDPSSYLPDTPNGTICMMPTNGADSYKALAGATKFDKMTWYGINRDNGRMMFIVCRLYDLTIGPDVTFENFVVMKQGYGQIVDTRMSDITLMCGYNNANYSADQIEYPTCNEISNVTTVKIQSGGIGRIIGANRNNVNHSVSHNIFGSPTKPMRSRVILDIDESKVTTCYDIQTKRMEPLDYQIGVLVGGQTDGTVYGDINITLERGIVGRLVTGNISFGRLIANYPADGFFGSAVFNCKGGTVYEMIGGTLGRCDAGGAYKTPEAYYYGRSVINISGGTLKNNIFVGGSGGTTGLGTKERHTDDTHIPYYKNGNLNYGNYDAATAAGATMPTMDSYSTKDGVVTKTTVDLGKSTCELNISGGTIEGDVFGGGFGYSDNIADATKIPKMPGYLFGNTTVTMTGGTVKGSLYGGGAGSNGFYKLSDHDDIYRTVGQIVGDTYVHVKSGTIEGSVYGGSKGVQGLDENDLHRFPEMATLYGNTKVIIGDWETGKVEIGGNVFGGGALSAVEGNTELTIRDCNTEIQGDVYGGGDAAPVFSTNTTVWGGNIGGNVFGGGNGSETTKNPNGAQVGYTHDDTTSGGTGNAVTNIFGGKIGIWTTDSDNNEVCTDGTGGVFGGSNTNGNIRGGITLVADERGETIDGVEYGQCTFQLNEMYGAGNKAAYDGTGGITFKLLCVRALDYIYGGAKDADYNGNINLTITSGTYKGVYGGNNLGGVVTGNITVNIDETGCEPVIIDKVYGGGRDAAYKGSPVVNVYSCTRIGEVYGGGCGEDEEKDATVTGNPVVNILQIPGKYDPDKALKATPELDATNKTKLGKIGNVYGGGEYAKVVGNTTVNIATQATKQKHLDTTYDDDEYVVGANIAENVYGGGNEADVTGKTQVIVGNGE